MGILLPDGRIVEPKENKNKIVPKGPPQVKAEMSGSSCPICGNKRIFMMEVKLLGNETDHLIGTYSGCPGCPWLSQMVITKDVKATANDNKTQ